MAAKHIVLITTGQPATNPRLVKEADTLKANGYRVTVLYAYWNEWATTADKQLLMSKSWKAIRVGGSPDNQRLTYFFSKVYHAICKRLLTGLINIGVGNFWLPYWLKLVAVGRVTPALIRAAKHLKADLYIAHNLGAIAASVLAARANKTLAGFDAEDYHRDETTDLVAYSDFNLNKILEDWFIPQLDYFTVSSPLIKALYDGHYKTPSITVRNIFPKHQGQEPVSGYYGKKPIKLCWFSQTIGPNRGLELLVKALDDLEPSNIELHLLGELKPGFKEKLAAQCNNWRNLKVFFHGTREPDALFDFLFACDIGITSEPAFCINNDAALSNKLFTYIQCGLALLLSDTTAQKAFFDEHPGIGKLYKKDSMEDLRTAIQYYLDNPSALSAVKSHNYQLSQTTINWDKEQQCFLQHVNSMLQPKREGANDRKTNKSVLIISPYFPPDNAADMHRVRMSLPFFAENGWDAEVVSVHPDYTDAVKDLRLLDSLPALSTIHYIKAWDKNTTSKFGLGSLALRSLWFYFKAVNRLLKSKKYDLIYFSTTQFPVTILGTYWKHKHQIKIVVDLQDPWHTTYYKQRPKAERPKKYWFSYHLNRIMEPIAMKAVDGLISVSAGYIQTLKERYPRINRLPTSVIPFGMNCTDLEIAIKKQDLEASILPRNGKKHVVYAGRGGHDLKPAMKLLFSALQYGQREHPERFNLLQIHLIGTSYAASGKGVPTFTSLISAFNLQGTVQEITDRIPFYRVINTLRAADLLFIPGPDQPVYTASKLFPYIMAQKPILAIMHKQSNALEILKRCDQACILHHHQSEDFTVSAILDQLNKLFESTERPTTDLSVFFSHSAAEHTRMQTTVFNAVCNNTL